MRLILLAGLLLGVTAMPAAAADPGSCRTVRMSDPGWTDITSTNALASTVLAGLGYKADIQSLSVPIGYQSIKNKQRDVFLGNWMPAQKAFRADLDDAKAAEVLNKNLVGAKFTLAVPDYVAEAGVKDFKDLAANADKFGDAIYGIEPGAPANANILKLIGADGSGLKDWKLVESSEQAMLAQVKRAARAEKWIVFLAWAPHPMNTQFKLSYLAGGDSYFGPDFGGAEVYTIARAGYAAECPNAGKLFSQITFSIDMENEMMGRILDEKIDPEVAAKAYLKANPHALDGWLAGVETADGKPGLAAVKASLGL